ncbi:MAG: copper chaperone PCu(A)C [Burkholderiales bacterium]
MRRGLLCGWLALNVSVAVVAGERVRVSGAWVPPTVPGQTVGAAYMHLRSPQDATLVKVEADVAAAAEVHRMTTVNDVMRMRKLDQLDLPAGRTVELSPGATHLMLVDLRQPLKAGDSVKLRLTVRLADGRTVRETVVAPVVQRASHGSHK